MRAVAKCCFAVLLATTAGVVCCPRTAWCCCQDGSPPTITIAKPAIAEEYVGGTTLIKAYISDPSGVAWAKFYVDDELRGDMSEESDYWRYNWYTSDTSGGIHTITIEASDHGGCVGSKERDVYVHPSVSLYRISFQADHALWNRYLDEAITEPQWSPTVTKPFAYTIGSQMTVNAQMTSSNVTGSVHIRYVVDGDWSGDAESYDADKSTSGAFPCWLAHYPTAPSKVADYTLSQSYDFYVRKSANSDWAWAGEGSADHPEVYLTFGAPVGPWGPSDKPRACWSHVIKDACEWMPGYGYTSAQQLDARKRLAYKAYMSSEKDYDGERTHCDGSGATFYMWDFITDPEEWADCRDMSSWWEKLCHAVGLSVDARRINGPFDTKWINPIGDTPASGPTSWNFHQVGWSSNVFDPCIKLNESTPRVPQDENINNPYKTDLYQPDSGSWSPQSPFSLSEVN
jgi:hypothetical protein